MVLAVGAVAMAAGVGHQLLMFTSCAFDLHLSAGGGAALFDGRECARVVRRESKPVLREEIGFEGVDDTRQPDHLTDPQVILKLSIRLLIRSMA